MSGPQAEITIGLEACCAEPPAVLSGRCFGLLMNQASLDRDFCYAHDVLAQRFPGQLAALFSPQHGLWGEQQANMIESPHGWEPRLGVPVYSLYSEVRRPTPEMLAGLDCLVVDLQDVGTRVYTFLWTISYCLEACAAAGIPAVILDRPNPLGGEIVEGPRLDPAYASFVGRTAIPMRHGLTIAEAAMVVNDALHIGAELHVVPMRGWRRSMWFADTGRAWVAPSPNLPRLEGVGLYPGMVLCEGTNLSEGRGTTTPFEVVGAPFVDPHRLLDALAAFELSGIALRPVWFVPMFDKWQGTRCGGVFVQVVDRAAARPYRTALAILAAVRRLWPDHFAWRLLPYEYEPEKMPIDIIAGGTDVRWAIEGQKCQTGQDLDRLAGDADPDWERTVRSFRLY